MANIHQPPAPGLEAYGFLGVEWGGKVVTEAFNVSHSHSAVNHATAKEAFLCITASSSTDQGLPHGFQQQQGSWTSTWPETTWTTDNSVSGSSTDRGGLLRRPNPEMNHSPSWTSCRCSEPRKWSDRAALA